MSFLDAVSAIHNKPKDLSILTGRLNKFLAGKEDTYAKDVYYHPSQLYGACARMEVLKRVVPLELLPLEKNEVYVTAKFDIGNAVHYWYQNYYLGQMGILKGKWRCCHCNAVTGTDPKPEFRPKKCDCGNTTEWDYEECHVLNKEWDVIGKVDGILDIDGKPYVLDMKTSDPELFKKMKKPWPSAEFQVQVYLWLTGIKDGVLLYIDKSSNGPDPTKEFSVKYSEETVDKVKSLVTTVRMSIESKSLPTCSCTGKWGNAKCEDIEKLSAIAGYLAKWLKGAA
jgi:hypothetical protein